MRSIASAVAFSHVHFFRRAITATSSPRALFSTMKNTNSSSSNNNNNTSILASFGSPQIGTNVEHAMQALAKAQAVCFDVDSTVITEEGIDVLGDFLGRGEEIQALTRSAMEGSQKFEDALRARLDLLQPSRQEILDCLQQHPLQPSPGIESLIELLHEYKKDVYLVSGGFKIMIQPIARELCVAKDHIYANTLLFDNDGNYVGFDPEEPTSRDMGKRRALEMIQKNNNYQTMVMIGDGATDAQAKPPADAFIGFGGVVTRDIVKEKACWFVTNFEDLEKVITEFATKE
jgi:phosphoserine phosphatase